MDDKLQVTTVTLTGAQIEFCRGKSGNVSRHLRGLIDQEMGREQSNQRHRALWVAASNILDAQQQKLTDLEADHSSQK